MAEERTYSPAEVAETLDISRITLDAWILRYFGGRGPGTGHARRITFAGVMRLAALVELNAQGIPVGKAAKLLRSVSKEFNEAVAAGKPTGRVMVVAGDQAVVGI